MLEDAQVPTFSRLLYSYFHGLPHHPAIPREANIDIDIDVDINVDICRYRRSYMSTSPEVGTWMWDDLHGFSFFVLWLIYLTCWLLMYTNLPS